MAKSFIDTNVFFYAVDGRDVVKQDNARALIERLANSGEGFVSIQVVQEFACNALKKLGFTPEQTSTLCEAFSDHTVVKPDLDMVTDALRLMSRESLSFWEACIVTAARKGQCKVLYTEDLNAGQLFGDVRVTNPFENATNSST